MIKNDRKEVTIVLFIVGIVLIIGLISSINHTEISVEPGCSQPLNATDFIIKTSGNKVEVGVSSWSAAADVFPGGQTLGMSTVYSAAPEKYLLTFTNQDNVLCKVDIYSSDIRTYRDATVGMTFEQVKQIYGDNYIQIIDKEHLHDFDAVYGTDGSIVFNVRDDRVWRIVVQRE